MTISLVSHVALSVVNLPRAERYYCDLFDLQVAFREAETAAGWRRLPPGKGWEDAAAADIELDMVMLFRGGLAWGLERASVVAESGSLSHIGLLVDEEEMRRLRQKLRRLDCVIIHDMGRALVFDDRYGVRWEPSLVEYTDPQRLGADPGRWLDL